MKTFVTAILGIVLSISASAQQPAYRESAVPFASVIVGSINSGLQSGGSQSRIVSQEIIQRVGSAGRIKSVRGRFTMRCDDGSSAETNIVTATATDLVPAAERSRLSAGGFVPVPSTDEGVGIVVTSLADKQTQDFMLLAKYIAGACVAKSSPDYRRIGYHLAVGLWVNRPSNLHSVVVGRIDKPTFESLK